MSEVKAYDWNGTLVTIDGFRRWIREQSEHKDLVAQFYDGDTDSKRAATPEMRAVFEDASQRGVYPVSLFPQVVERLERDGEEGYLRVVLSTVSPEPLARQAAELGIGNKIDQFVSLEEVLRFSGLQSLAKEDAGVYRSLAAMLGLPCKTYVDDTPARVVAARDATVFQRVFLFDSKGTAEAGQGYTVVTNIMDVQ